MKNKLVIIAYLLSLLGFAGCQTMITRTDEDVYTKVFRDTTTLNEVKNAPGNRDNGIVYPSSRTVNSQRSILRTDSTVYREYPNFIRLGAFEAVGLFLAGDKNYGGGTGLFGIFPDFDSLSTKYRGKNNYTFPGGIWRLGIGEWRLRWFRDSPNWTLGTSLLEVIAPDARIEKTLASILPIYIRKRFFLREEIPYIAITPAFGIGYYPSQYINLSASIDVGSLGGLNLRGYVGFATGVNGPQSPQVQGSPDPTTRVAQTIVTPYMGIGISFLDFLNIVPETYQEWKDHQHSSWNVGLLQISAISSNVKKSLFSNDSAQNASKFITGIMARVAPASIALPIEPFGYKMYAGTSLINYIALGENEWGLGILPIRLGFWQTVLADELTTEPFIEYNYYPSNMLHIGNRLNLRLHPSLNLSISIGYVSGSTDRQRFGSYFRSGLGDQTSFSRFYIGFGLGFQDDIFFPEELRYLKNNN
jgi:hypothetical protein